MADDIALTGELTDCPGIGKEGVKKLTSKGVKNLCNLLGLGLSFNGDKERLKSALEKDYDIHKKCVPAALTG